MSPTYGDILKHPKKKKIPTNKQQKKSKPNNSPRTVMLYFLSLFYILAVCVCTLVISGLLYLFKSVSHRCFLFNYLLFFLICPAKLSAFSRTGQQPWNKSPYLRDNSCSTLPSMGRSSQCRRSQQRRFLNEENPRQIRTKWLP